MNKSSQYRTSRALDMKASKLEAYDSRQVALATVARALGHPARIAILEYLAKVNRCICGQIVDELPLAQATVSQHLKELKAVGLIKGTVEGASVCYCLDAQRWHEVKALFNDLFERLDKGASCC